ncbi:MAG: crossover junction endodeoxyribonuclease RuvC [Clostridiales bacterium]|nr:crossover junction endodeoxyribonuclease RuvC [Clostridiales bacterium]
MIILGIDPGTAITGYGLIEAIGSRCRLLDYGCIRTTPGLSAPRRLEKLHSGMMQLLAEGKPEQVAVEKLFFNRNATTAIPVGQARGVLLLACAQNGLDVAEYTPLQVKQSIVGYGRAEKHQIQFMVARLLQMKAPPKSDDAADALALALTHAQFLLTRVLRGESAKGEDV